MVIVKNGLKGKNPEAKVTFGTKVAGKMTLNANFPDDAAVVLALSTATAKLDDAIKDPNGTAKTVQSKVTVFNTKMRAAVAHVQTVVNEFEDDIAILMVQSAALDYEVKQAIHIGDLTAKQGKEAKSIKVRRKAEKKRVTYVFQICTDPSNDTNWKNAKVSSRASVIITDLISHQVYYLRVAIIRGDVQEDFSDYISIQVD